MAAEITYKKLNKTVTDLAKQVVRGSEAIKASGTEISEAALDTARIAEGIASLGVDPDTIAETRALARMLTGLSEATGTYMGAADTTAKSAKAAHDQNRTSHQGIAEAFGRSPVDLSGVKPGWFSQS